MKQIRLRVLKLKNFKGIKDFTFTPEGKNATISGDNAAGKTTIYDAVLWLLFDKDSANKKDFSIKPHDSAGKEIHFLETEVEAELLVDGKAVMLRKMFCEKWTKKRGQADQEFSGHETSYWVDDVPLKMNEYKAKTDAIIGEELFKMLANQAYFMMLKWQDRRSVLLAIAGDLSDEDIISGNPKLAALTEALNGNSIDDHKKILTERIRKLNKEKEEIPLRIDELTMSLPSTVALNVDIELSELTREHDEIEVAMSASRKQGELQQRRQHELFNMRNDLDTLKRKSVEKANEGRKKMIQEKSNLESKKVNLEGCIAIANERIQYNNDNLKRYAAKRKELLDTRMDLSARVFVEPAEGTFICPTCKQILPEETKEVKLISMRECFEVDKKRGLDTNLAEGLNVKSWIEKAESENVKLQESVSDLNKTIADIEAEISKIDTDMPIETVDAVEVFDPDSMVIESKIKDLEAELKMPVEDRTAALLQDKSEIQIKIDVCRKVIYQREAAESTAKRIEELKAEEKRLAQQISDNEKERDLIEMFIVTKVNLLTDSINNKFEITRWKLFDKQINGGLAECCEALVNTNGSWVPYSDGANYGGKVNSGLDIINTLSGYFDVSTFIFVDNCESVSVLTAMDTQVIRLEKVKDLKALKVEVGV